VPVPCLPCWWQSPVSRVGGSLSPVSRVGGSPLSPVLVAVPCLRCWWQSPVSCVGGSPLYPVLVAVPYLPCVLVAVPCLPCVLVTVPCLLCVLVTVPCLPCVLVTVPCLLCWWQSFQELGNHLTAVYSSLQQFTSISDSWFQSVAWWQFTLSFSWKQCILVGSCLTNSIPVWVVPPLSSWQYLVQLVAVLCLPFPGSPLFPVLSTVPCFAQLGTLSYTRRT
jgi:hypothetical protein